jgi:hypothetical protein
VSLLAREGARVGLLDAVPEWAAETLRMIESEGGTALAITVSLPLREKKEEAAPPG